MDPAHPMHAQNQTIETLLSADYWQAMCPWLCCTVQPKKSDFSHQPTTNDDLIASAPRGNCSGVAHRLAQFGFCKLLPHEMVEPVRAGLINALARGVLVLVHAGHPASALAVYDEAWELAACISREFCTTGNVPLGDWFTFCVDRGGAQTSGWAPHRDRPLAGPDTFRSDGSPMYVTAWMALTDATPETSCLYFVPSHDDPGYRQAGDNMESLFSSPVSIQNIVAQPAAAGTMLCFSHRTVHWGSKPRQSSGCEDENDERVPRVALSLAFADPTFEVAYFSEDFLPLPPLTLRVALVSGQLIMYKTQVKLTKPQLALHFRIFMSQKALFSNAYVEKISTSAQFLKFLARR
jgi:hypothetical protein